MYLYVFIYMYLYDKQFPMFHQNIFIICVLILTFIYFGKKKQ